ncbi:MAG: archease [Promethearchaeota archaeon]
MNDAGFEFLDHTADVQAKSWGKNFEEATAQMALALSATISPNLKLIEPKIEKIIEISAEDKESLLFDFLSELLFIFDVEQIVFSDVKIVNFKKENASYYLKAILKGERFNLNKHEYGTEIKAITYSFMEINESDDKVEIIMIFDI